MKKRIVKSFRSLPQRIKAEINEQNSKGFPGSLEKVKLTIKNQVSEAVMFEFEDTQYIILLDMKSSKQLMHVDSTAKNKKEEEVEDWEIPSVEEDFDDTESE